jgi:peroxiredoxin
MKRGLAVGAVLLAMPLILTGCGREQPASALVGTEQVADDEREDVLQFTGTTLDGSTFDLARLRGKVVVLNAWASWCPPCISEMPAFVDLHDSVDPADVAVIGLNVGDDPAAAQAFIDEMGMSFPNIDDTSGAILASIPGVPPKSLPSTVILDREGRIATRIIGPTDPIGLATQLGQVLGTDTVGAS